jgi:hypothetical protein
MITGARRLGRPAGPLLARWVWRNGASSLGQVNVGRGGVPEAGLMRVIDPRLQVLLGILKLDVTAVPGIRDGLAAKEAPPMHPADLDPA